MMKTLPAAALVMSKAELLLEFLVVALNAPAHLGDEDQLLQCGVGRGGRKKVFGRFGFALRPFDQQPFLRARLATLPTPRSCDFFRNPLKSPLKLP